MNLKRFEFTGLKGVYGIYAFDWEHAFYKIRKYISGWDEPILRPNF